MNKKLSPLVSVITAVYNQENFLKETIECVINQTFRDWEYILVDDGSSDKSGQIAKEYAKNHPGKIIYLEHENHVNKGVSATRNLGLQEAQGEYIALIDGDDLWGPEKLQRQVKIFQENPQVGLVCESSYYWKNGSDKVVDSVKKPVGVPGNRIYNQPELVLKLHPLGKGEAPCVGGIIMKTSVIKALGGFEKSFVGKNSLYEDQAFLIKIYLTEPVFVSSDCNNIYRLHHESAMHSIIAQGHALQGRHFFLKWLSAYLTDQQIQNRAVHTLLKKAFWPYKYPPLFKVLNKLFSVVRGLWG